MLAVAGLKSDLDSSNKAKQEQAGKLSEANAEIARLQHELNGSTE